MGDDRSTSSEQPELSPHHREHDVRHYSEDNVALRLAWEMRRRGWSQERMAQELTNAGCPTHQSAISKIINPKTDGNRRTISVDEAIAMARVFGIPLEELPSHPKAARDATCTTSPGPSPTRAATPPTSTPSTCSPGPACATACPATTAAPPTRTS
ncbi:helix-turn-helix domain-containing protein [Nonomuraea rubra]|uniref:helix-turn-helix domain-containing protein n=1 Tax=Nonomuraea rubra TaxID=46180 RepID=UPI003606DC40